MTMIDANLTPCDHLDYTYDGLTMIYGLKNPATGISTANLYVWGLDLSGSLQGAGGIGGLLTAQLNNPTTSNSTTVLYTYCANGNVSELVDTTGTNILAHYEYSPFGEAIVATGPLAEVNAIRFSTRYFDIETGIGKWPYRDYATETGRWLSKDPIGEEGGWNVYGSVGNNPLSRIDPLGWSSCRTCSGTGGSGSDPHDCCCGRQKYDSYTHCCCADTLKLWEKHLRGNISWRGSCTFVGGGEIVGAGALSCNLTSDVLYDCSQHSIIVSAILAGGTLGAPVSAINFPVEFRTDDASDFNGTAGIQAAGISAGWGQGIGRVALGGADTGNITSGPETGIDFGATAMVGVSHVQVDTTLDLMSCARWQ